MTRLALLLCGIGAIALTACAAPSTRKHDISSEEFEAEQKAQRQYVVRSRLKYIARLQDIAYPLLVGAANLCGEDIGLEDGLVLGSEHDYEDAVWREAARAEIGLGSLPTVLHTVKGSSSEFAGFRVGDKIVAVNGWSLRPGKDSIESMYDLIDAGLDAADGSDENDGSTRSTPLEPLVAYRVDRNGRRLDIATAGVPACSYPVRFASGEIINAYADGENLVVFSGLMNILDDYELATVMSHELGHNIMGHRDAKGVNEAIGTGVGLVFDILAALAGVNSHGVFSDIGGAAGAGAYSQDFETEADYVGVYIMARAGHQVDNAGNLWRKMTAQSGGQSIEYASTHPTSAERAVRIRKTAAEIKRKMALGHPLFPDAQPYVAPKPAKTGDEEGARGGGK